MTNRFVAAVFVAIGVIVAASAVLWPRVLSELPLLHLSMLGATAESAQVLFVGDVMLDRAVAVHAAAVGDGALFAGAQELFVAQDAVVGNLEGTITSMPSVAQASTTILRFTFSPKVAPLLKDAGFSAMSLANNHSLDFGTAGYTQTVEHLRQAGIEAFGSPLNDKNISAVLNVRGQTICLVGYMQLFNPDPTHTIETLHKIRPNCDHVVVFAHWGVEYKHEPTDAQREAAHAFIDAGADVVIGAHPHVVEPLEVYKNHAIFYSLGNFIFDQGWMPQVKRGLAVAITFGEKKTTFTLVAVNTYEEASIADAAVTKTVLDDVGVDSPTLVLTN